MFKKLICTNFDSGEIGKTVVFTPTYSHNWLNWYWCVCFFFLFRFLFSTFSYLPRFFFPVRVFFFLYRLFFQPFAMIWSDFIMVIRWSPCSNVVSRPRTKSLRIMPIRCPSASKRKQCSQAVQQPIHPHTPEDRHRYRYRYIHTYRAAHTEENNLDIDRRTNIKIFNAGSKNNNNNNKSPVKRIQTYRHTHTQSAPVRKKKESGIRCSVSRVLNAKVKTNLITSTKLSNALLFPCFVVFDPKIIVRFVIVFIFTIRVHQMCYFKVDALQISNYLYLYFKYLMLC